MNPVEQLQLRRGSVGIGVFQAEDDGKILLTLDRHIFGQNTNGPFFTEAEGSILAELLQEYLQNDSHLFHAGPDVPTCSPAVRQEIETAIKKTATIQTGKAKQGKTKITVLPSLPKYTYCYTCPKCGCHTASNLRVSPTLSFKLCSYCQHVLAAQC